MLNFLAILIFIFWILAICWVLLRIFYIPKPSTFSLYFGSPGCGKTTFLTRLALKRKDKFNVFCNFANNISNTYKFDKKSFSKFKFPEGSLILFDEGSLNGFDNRDYKKNFDSNTLEYMKLARHFKNQIVFSNQGWDELDKKIRILTNDLWFVRKIGSFSIARRVVAKTQVDELTHQIIDGYEFVSGLKFLLLPKYCQIIYRPRYYKYFDSFDRPERPEIIKLSWTSKNSVISKK